MAGKRQKHPDTLQNKWGGRYVAPVKLEARSVTKAPRAPNGLGPGARHAWKIMWSSPLAQSFKETDTIALYRWVWWLDEWMNTAAAVKKLGPETEGISGPILAPRVRYLQTCEKNLIHFEQAFGLDALARLRLGLTLVDEKKAVESLKTPMPPETVTV